MSIMGDRYNDDMPVYHGSACPCCGHKGSQKDPDSSMLSRNRECDDCHSVFYDDDYSAPQVIKDNRGKR